MQSSLFDIAPARVTDPDTSVQAAVQTRLYNGTLVQAIRAACENARRPLTQSQIAEHVEHVHGNRWKTSTIITACARANLQRVGTLTVDGRPLATWTCS